MKALLGLGTALALMLTVVPVMAEQDSQFRALNQITAEATQTLSQMSDEQLQSIEGTASICAVCLNVAAIVQANTVLAQAQLVGANQWLGQANSASVYQALKQ